MYSPQVIARLVERAAVFCHPDLDDICCRIINFDHELKKVHAVGEESNDEYWLSYSDFPLTTTFYGFILLNPESCDGSEFC